MLTLINLLNLIQLSLLHIKIRWCCSKALESIYSGDFDKTDDTNIQFRGGQNIVLGAKDGDVGLPLETSKFEKFTEADYNAIYDKIVDGSVKIKNNKDAESPKDLNCSNVELTIEN